MYRCKICRKVYVAPVKYCDCGNDEFEVVVQQQPKQASLYNIQNIISWIIFLLCLTAAVLVWFI